MREKNFAARGFFSARITRCIGCPSKLDFAKGKRRSEMRFVFPAILLLEAGNLLSFWPSANIFCIGLFLRARQSAGNFCGMFRLRSAVRALRIYLLRKNRFKFRFILRADKKCFRAQMRISRFLQFAAIHLNISQFLRRFRRFFFFGRGALKTLKEALPQKKGGEFFTGIKPMHKILCIKRNFAAKQCFASEQSLAANRNFFSQSQCNVLFS
ncbi:MAG: hypothetical protein DBX55_06215 [Verrucomicrobia bacterium]|nr:MAG: hypothetical protein DBX55_06215 [Verrucomicrobiota bacterium]